MPASTKAQMIIRVQTPDHGTRRFQCSSSDSTDVLIRKLVEEFSLGDTGWSLYTSRDKNPASEIKASRRKTLKGCGLKHGDMVYVLPKQGFWTLGVEREVDEDSRPGSSASATGPEGPPTRDVTIEEDSVDQELSRQDGRIERSRNPQLCQHNAGSKCLHCASLEPWDEAYLKSLNPPVKFLSFHSYIRKLTQGSKGKFVALENLSCKIRPGCKEHLPWPKGICTKCQPSAVTLSRQPYRHVDYIEFENPQIVDRYLDFWRSTGAQRIGLLYGRYEPHKEVPLGIRAVVQAIYEPPQNSSRSSVELLDDPHEAAVERMARGVGLQCVGWIFTDLLPLDVKQGSVKHYRGSTDSHFLSAEECILAGTLQNKFPNPCRMSREAHFGSKFVTVVVTGDSKNQIHFEGYQVSNQCMALVRDECLVPTKDAPELAYVKESSTSQYVPDVFFTEKDQYGNEVKRLGRPLPVEYLLVDMPAAFPQQPSHSFAAKEERLPFVVENRAKAGQMQDFAMFNSYMRQFGGADHFLEAVSDFHALLFMSTCDTLPLKDDLDLLYRAIREENAELGMQFLSSENWQTVEHLMEGSLPSPTPSDLERKRSFVGPNASPLPPIGQWACQHCTFVNQGDVSECGMCSLPKQ